MQLFKKSYKQGWVAIKATADDTSIAHVERRSNQRPLVHLATTVGQNIFQPSTLKTISQQFSLKKKMCSLVLNTQDYQLIQVEKPNVPKAEQKQAVRWKLKDLMDYSIENATIDVLEIPAEGTPSGRMSHVYAAAAPNEVIGSLSNCFLDSGVQLKAIDIQETAQRNIASLLEQKDRGLALLSVSASGGLLTFTSGGELYHARRIEFDGNYSESTYERIALELQRSLDHFERQFPQVVISQLLVAPFAETARFCDYLRNFLYIPVERFEFADIFDFGDEVRLDDLTEQARLFTVIGAALREEIVP